MISDIVRQSLEFGEPEQVVEPIELKAILAPPERESSVIDTFEYDTEEKTLLVTFKSGAEYAYSDVPRSMFTKFKYAKSRGRFFSLHIRDKFPTAQLSSASKFQSSVKHEDHDQDDHGNWSRRRPIRPEDKDYYDTARKYWLLTLRDNENARAFGNIINRARQATTRTELDEISEQYNHMIEEIQTHRLAPGAPTPKKMDIVQRAYEDVILPIFNRTSEALAIQNHLINSEYGDIFLKDEECESCGASAIGFLGDAFLCKQCMTSAMGNVAVPKWVLESKQHENAVSEATEWGETVKRFHLQRDVDESGVSGTGYVAEGVELRNDMCVVWWVAGDVTSIVSYKDIGEVEKIHGHGGNTKVVWDDS